MLTISSRVETWLKAHPFHASFMAQGLINASSLARVIRPELEADAGIMLSLEAITLALNRHSKRQNSTLPTDYNQFIGEFSVQTGLSVLTVPQVNLDVDAFYDAVKSMHKRQEYTLYTRGAWHTALIGKQHEIEQLSKRFSNTIVTHDQVGITVKLKPGHLPTPGVCAFVLQKLAQNSINITEVTSSHDELTIVIDRDLTQAALNCLL